MRRITHTFLKIAVTAFCVVFVFTVPGSKGLPQGHTNLSAAPYVYAADLKHGLFACPEGEVHTGPTIKSPCGTQAEADKAAETRAQTASWTDWVNFIISGAFLIYLSGMLLYFAGYLLNGSIQLFVVEMGSALASGQHGTALGNAIVTSWGIIRDIINLTFVFGMIYLAFMTIVQANTSKLKHGVVQIIIAALLINFSLFFGKAVIDFGNVAALEIYSYMESKASNSQNDSLNYGISGFFVDRMGLIQFFDAKKLIANGENPTLAFDNKSGFGFAILISIVLLIASFVFFAGAILISIRFITLALLLVLSPVAFAKAALPGINTEEWSQKWWSSLVSQVIFLPAYFLMLYISMTAIGEREIGSDMTAFFKGEGDINSVKIILNFVLIIGFLVGSLIISKRMGAYGASTVNAWGMSIAKGTGSMLARNTVGRVAAWQLKKEDSANAARSRTRGGRLMNSILYTTGLDGAVRGTLSKAANSNFGGGNSYESAQKQKREFDLHNATHSREHDREHAVEAGLAVMNTLNASGSAASAEQLEAIKALASSLKDMTDTERAGLKVKVLSNEHVAMHLSDKHIEALEKNENISADDVAKIKEARQRAFKNAATGSGPGFIQGARNADWLGSRSTKDIAALPVSVLTHPAMLQYLSPEIVKQKLEDGMSAADQDTLRTSIQGALNSIRTAHATGTASPVGLAYEKSFVQWSNNTTHGAKFGLI